jgi:geranylgeranyl diphosphate synthase type I
VAAARARGAAAHRLEKLGRPDLDDAEIAGLQAVLVDTGAVDEMERSIERLVDEALDALAVVPIRSEARVALEELGTFVAWRDR